MHECLLADRREVGLPVHMSVHVPIRSSVHMSIHMPTHMSVHMCVCVPLPYPLTQYACTHSPVGMVGITLCSDMSMRISKHIYAHVYAQECLSADGKKFFYHAESRKTQWDYPMA